MADWRTALQRVGRSSTRKVQKERRDFQRALQADRRRRLQAAGTNIEELLVAGRFKEAWNHLTQWYRQWRCKEARPTREGLDQVSADRAELYRCRPPEGLWVPLLLQPSVVSDDIPSEAEIEMAVKRLKVRRAGGLSFMRV